MIFQFFGGGGATGVCVCVCVCVYVGGGGAQCPSFTLCNLDLISSAAMQECLYDQSPVTFTRKYVYSCIVS